MTAMPIKEITGKHVLLICFVFFGVMFAVNSLFVFYALSTFNGGEGKKPYQSGLDYNETIAAARAQDALGWSHRITAGRSGEVSIALSAKSGAPVVGRALTGEIARPVADRFTHPLVFREVAPGTYAAEAGPLDAGSWLVSLAVHPGAKPDETVYRAKERLWLKPNS